MPTKAQLEGELAAAKSRNVQCALREREAYAARDKAIDIIKRIRNRDGLRARLMQAEESLKEVTEDRDELQSKIAKAEAEMQGEWAKSRYGPNVGIDDIGDIVKIAEAADDEREHNQNMLDIEERKLLTAFRKIEKMTAILKLHNINPD